MAREAADQAVEAAGLGNHFIATASPDNPMIAGACFLSVESSTCHEA